MANHELVPATAGETGRAPWTPGGAAAGAAGATGATLPEPGVPGSQTGSARAAPGPATRGWVHSVETAGTLDGPGIRFVVFTSGCPLRCVYCHNPDARAMHGGRLRTAGDLVEEVESYAPFLKITGGGLTVSGGEPLLQPAFVEAIFAGARELGVHTALDTSGFLGKRASDRLLQLTDLTLLDIKSFDPATYRSVTGVSLRPTLDFARRLADRGRPAWIRFVLVPGVTDAPGNVAGLADFVAGLTNVERVEVLPFHKMGEYKWQSLGLPYTLRDVQPPTPEQVESVRQIFRERGLLSV